MCQIDVIKKKERNGTNMSHGDIFLLIHQLAKVTEEKKKCIFLKK